MINRVFFLLIGITLTTSLVAQNSYLQIIAEPDISVFVDGTFKGRTSLEFEGLIVENLPSGTHQVKLIKEGYYPLEESIELKSGEVFQFKPKNFTEISDNQPQQTFQRGLGAIKIQSVPITIHIEIPSIGFDSQKSDDLWIAEDIPAGVYELVFKYKDKQLRKTVSVGVGETIELFVNFVQSTVNMQSDQSPKITVRQVSGENQTEKKGVTTTTITNTASDLNSFTDPRDGRTYKTVKIGDQIWMAENLAWLPELTHPNKVGGGIRYFVPGYTQADINQARSTDNYSRYGVLYSYQAAVTSCPPGWHLPRDSEWEDLEVFLGMPESSRGLNWRKQRGDEGIGTKLKSRSGWSNNGNGTDEVGFNALPAGIHASMEFRYIHDGAVFWASDSKSFDMGWSRELKYNWTGIGRRGWGKNASLSVRCIKE